MRTTFASVRASPQIARVSGELNGVVEVDRVEVEDVVDPGPADGAPLLALAQQAERRALLGADRVAAALTAGDRDDAGLERRDPRPRRRRRGGERLVVGMRADEEDVEVHRPSGPAVSGRRRRPAPGTPPSSEPPPSHACHATFPTEPRAPLSHRRDAGRRGCSPPAGGTQTPATVAGVPPSKRLEVEVDGRTLSLSNLDKVFYPEAGFTKGQVIEYYTRVAPAAAAAPARPAADAQALPERRRRARTSTRSSARRTGPTGCATAGVVARARRPRIDFCLVRRPRDARLAGQPRRPRAAHVARRSPRRPSSRR